MLHSQYVPATCVPKFVDCLSLGFWTAIAFSPTVRNLRLPSLAPLDRADLSGSASADR
jgi:hypothetical protein